MAESLSINGTDLATLMTIQSHPGLVGAPLVQGADFDLPRHPGAISGVRWAGSRIASIQGLVYGSSATSAVPADARARYLDGIRALTKLVWNNGADLTLSRVIPRVTGGDLTAAAQGRYAGGLDQIEQAAGHAARVAFDLRIFDPYWYATTPTALTVAPTLTPAVVGDVATKRMTITFSGATGQRLTNSTTGEWVQIVGSAVNSTVLDVEAFTAVRSAVSVAGEVTHNGSFTHWMSLAAGSNSLALTGGGSCAISYTEAYL